MRAWTTRDLQADCHSVLEGRCWRCGGPLEAGDCVSCERHMETAGEPGKLWLFDGGLGSSAFGPAFAVNPCPNA